MEEILKVIEKEINNGKEQMEEWEEELSREVCYPAENPDQWCLEQDLAYNRGALDALRWVKEILERK